MQYKIALHDSFLLHFVPCYKKLFSISCLAYCFVIHQIIALIAFLSSYQELLYLLVKTSHNKRDFILRK